MSLKKLFIRSINQCSRKKLHESKIIKESFITGKTFINVDIQPIYEHAFYFNLGEWCEFNNELIENNEVVFFYNGSETVGTITEQEYKWWIYENGGSEDLIYNAHFYDKGYAFFRSCMDKSIYEEDIVHLIKYMLTNNIYDARDMDDEHWKDFISNYDIEESEEIQEILRDTEEFFAIPELMEEIKRYNNVVLTGGGISECLKEVELAFRALDKPYKIYEDYTF